MHLSHRSVIALAAATTLAVAIPTTMAATGGGGGMPANKAVAAGSHRVVFGPAAATPIMSATFKTSKPEDLLLTVSLECTILTALTTNNGNPSASARAGIDIWIQDETGKVVPISDTSAPPQDPSANGNGSAAADGVTFCDREYARSVTDQENPPNGIDKIDDYIKTKSAHAFSWVRLNAGSGLHTYTVFANLRETIDHQADAQAEIGNRTFVIEPTKLANNASIIENGTS